MQCALWETYRMQPGDPVMNSSRGAAPRRLRGAGRARGRGRRPGAARHRSVAPCPRTIHEPTCDDVFHVRTGKRRTAAHCQTHTVCCVCAHMWLGPPAQPVGNQGQGQANERHDERLRTVRSRLLWGLGFVGTVLAPENLSFEFCVRADGRAPTQRGGGGAPKDEYRVGDR